MRGSGFWFLVSGFWLVTQCFEKLENQEPRTRDQKPYPKPPLEMGAARPYTLPLVDLQTFRRGLASKRPVQVKQMMMKLTKFSLLSGSFILLAVLACGV